MRNALLAALAAFVAHGPVAAQEPSGQTPFEAFDAGRSAEALEGAREGIQSDPANPVWWALSAEALAKLERHDEAAEAFARAAALETRAEQRSYFLRAQTFQLVLAGRQEDARSVLRQAMGEPSLETQSSLDWAMVAIAAGDDRAAQMLLANEAVYAKFTRQSALDAAYSAKRRGLDERAVRFFQMGLAADGHETTPLDPITCESVRREIRELTRDWSFLGQISYSTAGQSGAFLTAPGGDDRAVQAGAEIARRIGGWQNGRPFSLFARVYRSQFLGSDVVVEDATQGWIGVRYKPLAALNLNVEASRLIGLDADGIDDWSLRTAISGGEGLEPVIGKRSYPFASYYGDVSYLIDADVTFGLAEGRAGYAFGLGTQPTTLTPYAVARFDYDSGRIEDEALGAGIGLSLRHWFAGTDTAAPRGFIDLDVQARERIAGDRRASGISATLTLGR